MIEHLGGTVIFKAEDHVVLDVNGVGYGLDLTARTSEVIGGVGAQAKLWVHTHVREETLSLFGFLTPGERRVFQIFLEVSGVGPKLALAILSSFSVEALVQIIMRNDANTLKTVPGVGLKKAEKLLVELKGKVKQLSAGIEPARLAELGGGRTTAGEFEPGTQTGRDAVAALEALDIPPSVARRAIARAIENLGETAPVEALVREGLRYRHG